MELQNFLIEEPETLPKFFNKMRAFRMIQSCSETSKGYQNFSSPLSIKKPS